MLGIETRVSDERMNQNAAIRRVARVPIATASGP
jgi:hypothetical protein